jgi:hypothetical protein
MNHRMGERVSIDIPINAHTADCRFIAARLVGVMFMRDMGRLVRRMRVELVERDQSSHTSASDHSAIPSAFR